MCIANYAEPSSIDQKLFNCLWFSWIRFTNCVIWGEIWSHPLRIERLCYFSSKVISFNLSFIICTHFDLVLNTEFRTRLRSGISQHNMPRKMYAWFEKKGDFGYYRQVWSLRMMGFCRPNCLKLGCIIQLGWKRFESNFEFNIFWNAPHDEENKNKTAKNT